MIINATYFNSGSLHIPNGQIVSRNRNETDTVSDLDKAIKVHERVLLINALNPTLWQAIEDRYSPEGVLDTDAPDWIKDLVNGKTYEIDGNSFVWDGLKDANSCLVYYVFSKYLEDDLYSYQVGGVSKLQNKGSERVDSGPLYQDRWNEFVSKYQSNNYNQHYPIVREYRSGTLLDYYNSDIKGGIVPLLKFIEDYETLNPGTYSNLVNKCYERVNSFGL
ncbi:hypothetical protein AAU57_11985 [Nonlabens sp. YIK11]|uniref:hypothetical protein n=1 Tax=Nonlabens sp. YIK11 TaxID=1453349 RepID=UPI0006DCF4F9|nr:hypothetical protein [Nonlabens sp. YIK11]KQC33968.1 hypothetical protein AAU57_11985 [Nonlabens sp. YIK11]